MRIAVQYPVVLLLIPVIIAVMLVTSRSLRIGNKVRKCFITGIRIVLFSLIICAMADISVNVSSRNTGTVFLLDVSESFAANKEEAVQMVQDALKKLPKDNRAAVVAFGQDARVEQFMSEVSLFTGGIKPIIAITCFYAQYFACFPILVILTTTDKKAIYSSNVTI